MQNPKSNRISHLLFQEKRVHFNRKSENNSSLKIMHSNIGGYFGQRRSISTRKVHVNIFFLENYDSRSLEQAPAYMIFTEI